MDLVQETLSQKGKFCRTNSALLLLFLSFILPVAVTAAENLFCKKEGIRKVGEGGEIGTQCSSSPLNKKCFERRWEGSYKIHPSSRTRFLSPPY